MKKLALLATLSFVTIAGAQEYPQTGRIGPAYIGGMEYWPFDDAIPGSPYPDRVLWSYDEGSDLAKKCMLKGNQLLVSWLKDDNHPVTKALKEYKEIGGTADFFMWTNDYSKAPAQAARGMRKSKVWWWSGSGSDTSGWLKFESTVSPDGTCSNPKPEQIVSYLESRYSLFAASPSENITDSSRVRGARPGFFDRVINFFRGDSASGSAR